MEPKQIGVKYVVVSDRKEEEMMDASKSKFDYGSFYGGYHHYAVNSGKYTKEEAIKIYEKNEEYKFKCPCCGGEKYRYSLQERGEIIWQQQQ